MTRKLWTTEENELIRTMREQGFTYKQMVPYFPGRNLRTISVQANKLLEPTKVLVAWTPEEEEFLIELKQGGCSYREIAEIMERSYSAVKTKGSYLLKSINSRASPKMSYEKRLGMVLSDMDKLERDYIEDGQEFFRF